MSPSWHLWTQFLFFSPKSSLPPLKRVPPKRSTWVTLQSFSLTFTLEAFRGSVRKACGVIQVCSGFIFICSVFFFLLQYHIKTSSCKWRFFPTASAFSQHEKWQCWGVPPLMTSSDKSRVLPQQKKLPLAA